MHREELSMDAQFYWNLFYETGAPELYLLYQKSLRRPPD